jgi:tripartite-type tricarboxylate transporter receptor subunit TctC
LSGELFKVVTSVDIVHVPYRGAPAAQTDLLSGQVQVIFDTLPAVMELIKAGRVRVLATGNRARSEVLPDVPAIDEFVPGYEAIGVGGIGAPRGTQDEIIEKLNSAINAGLTDPEVKARIVSLGPLTFAVMNSRYHGSTKAW